MTNLSSATSLKRVLSKVYQGSCLSLRQRIWLVFGGLVCFSVLTTSLTVLQQTRTSEVSAQLATESRGQMILGTEVLDTLSEIDQRSRLGESVEWENHRFRELIKTYGTGLHGEADAATLLKRIDFRFDSYVDSLPEEGKPANNPGSTSLTRTYFQDVVKDVNELIEMNANSTFHSLREMNEWQQHARNIALSGLLAFVLLSAIAGFIMTRLVTRPLWSLVQFLDRVNVEDDFPTDLKQIDSGVPEISMVTQGFQQLIERLRGYRALNVRRLLVEKRRADIIAASISDGIFLLRGDEILYVNPVGSRILDIPGNASGTLNGSAPVGLNLRKLAEPTQRGLVEETSPEKLRSDAGNRCARAILLSISQTMPVEMEVERGDGKSHYLIQAYPISYDLIEEVEHSVKGPLEKIIDRFQANTIVVAQDVTLVREGQEAKGHFLATLSHEIKTPVTSLTMATRLLSKTVDQIPNPSQRNLIQTCVEDVDRLRRLLDDLLNISRFDTIIQKLEFQNIDLVKLLKNSVQSFQTQAKQKDISLSFAAQGKTPEERIGKNLIVPMDPSKVAWAVSNLLTNALRHTPRGGAVEARVISAGDEWVEVRVKDTGPGIDHKRQNRVFDKFSPFYDIRVARTGSTGAGLSIAREIVTAHGGRIWVSSEPGQGAEFGFTLPLKRRPTDGRPTGTSPSGLIGSKSGITETAKGETPFKKGAASGASACS